MDLRSRLEALLERDLQFNNTYRPTNTPLLLEGHDILTIETPAKLKFPQAPRTHSCLPPRSQPQMPQSRGPLNFGSIFSDPTPLHFISDSPLVTPSRFRNY